METLLMIVTVIALALAIGMSVLAWRLLREHRRRSDARAQILQAMAAEADQPARFATLDEDRDELRDDSDERPDEVDRSAADRQRFWWVPAGALASAVTLAAAGAAAYALSHPVAASAFGWRALSPEPLELLSLRHSADPGAFVVTGLVRNPSEGVSRQNVMAVLYLFDRDGNYFASGRTPLDFTALRPGEESPFIVRVPGVAGVSRYRIAFRSEASGVIAHVDRRAQRTDIRPDAAVERPAPSASAAQRPESRP